MHELAQQALDRVRLKAEYFVDVQLWPVPTDFDTEGWLGNFSDADLPLAALLLDSFIFLSERMTSALFLSAVQAISGDQRHPSRAHATAAWRAFIENAMFCIVTGETPNPSDSGYIFARKSRQILGIGEDQLVEPHVCLERLHAGSSSHAVIFVDDFVGSGSQFSRMWTREYTVRGAQVSFSALGPSGLGATFVYCPVVTTAAGVQYLAAECPRVALRPAYILDPRSSPLHVDTAVFPADLREAGHEMIRRVSSDLGMPDTDGADVDDWQGFGKLGCAFSFAHCIPDATLPLFRWEKDWKPLMRRT